MCWSKNLGRSYSNNTGPSNGDYVAVQYTYQEIIKKKKGCHQELRLDQYTCKAQYDIAGKTKVIPDFL